MGLKEYVFGFYAEKRAAEFLKKQNFKILAQNFRCKFGEIDIIAQKNEILHFIEVKATNGDYEAIYRLTPVKFSKILKAVDFYFLKNDCEQNFQIDLIEITPKGLNFVENISL